MPSFTPNWKVINIADTGTASKFGGDDTDKIGKAFNGIDVDDVVMNCDWEFLDGKLYLRNPADTSYTQLRSGAVSANRILNLPAVTATDTLACLGLSQTFTQTQHIALSSSEDLLYLYKAVSANGNNIDLNFDFDNTTPTRTTYCDIRSSIVDGTAGQEDAKFSVQLMEAGTKATKFTVQNTGVVDIGTNQRLRLSESGLTGQNTYTFPNSSEEVLGRDSVQSPKNKTFTVGYGNTGGNIFNGITLENPYLTTETGATVIRTGFFHACGSTTSDGILNAGITSINAGSTDKDATQGIGFQYATGAVANNNAGLRWTTTLFRRDWGSYVILRIHPSSTSDIRCFVGFSSDTAEISGETTLNNFSGAGVGKRAGDTNWFTMVNDGDATEDRADTGVAFAASPVTIELALNSTNFRSRIGSTENTAVTTELPATTTNLGLHVEIETGAGAADKNIIIYPIYARLGAI